MKIKTIISILLLLFIVVSVVYMLAKEIRSPTESSDSERNLQPVVKSNEQALKLMDSKVALYYFHGTARCPTCRKFESYSNEALQQAFAENLNNGRLEWKVVNVDEPGNQHYVSDYQLYSKSIVIVKIQDGEQLAWKNLNRIWELVRNKDAFIKYIQDEVRTYLETD